MSDLDVAALEATLHAGCLEAIARYREVAAPGDPATAFAIDAAPYYGTFAPSFDTRSSTLAGLRGRSAQVAADRAWTRDPDPAAWNTAHLFARHQSLRLLSDELGDWSHHMIHEISTDLRAFTSSDRYRVLNVEAGVDGWIEGRCRGVLTRVCDRLVDDGAFAGLELAVPFGVGYAYASEPLIVCRLIVP